jgi:hypothetical protein
LFFIHHVFLTFEAIVALKKEFLMKRLLFVLFTFSFLFTVSCDKEVVKYRTETCDNQIDDDEDGFVDCDDQDCIDFEGCLSEVCDDGLDNDGNGFVDCADSAACSTDGSSLSEAEMLEASNNGTLLSLGCHIYSKECVPNIACFVAESSDVTCPSTDGMGVCSSDEICVCIGESTAIEDEICDDGIDNNSNGFVDCVDEACASADNCIVGGPCAGVNTLCAMGTTDGTDILCPTSDGTYVNTGTCSEINECVCATIVIPDEVCDDAIDNDSDGDMDCDDSDCADDPACQVGVENCGNGIDDDEDGFADCDDQDCFSNPVCTLEICDNSIDDDGDGDTDCADAECVDTTYCQSVDPEICDDGIDNDGDGLTDCGDIVDCSAAANCQSVDPEICDDGIDNDSDGLTDCDDVDDCSAAANCQTVDPEICDNSIDDDGDGLIDCADTDDCSAAANCQGGGTEICDNSADDDGDTFAGCVDDDCQGDAACASYLNECSSGDNPGATCFPGFGKPCGSSGQCAQYDTDGDALLDCVCP